MKYQNRKNEKNKKKKSVLEQELFSIMHKSLKTAINMALDEILKDFNK